MDAIFPLDLFTRELLPLFSASEDLVALAHTCRLFRDSLPEVPLFEGIYEACELGHLPYLKFFFPGAARPLFPLCAHYAAFDGHLDVLEWLFENTDVREEYDPSELHVSAKCGGHENIAEWLHLNGFKETWDIRGLLRYLAPDLFPVPLPLKLQFSLSYLCISYLLKVFCFKLLQKASSPEFPALSLLPPAYVY